MILVKVSNATISLARFNGSLVNIAVNDNPGVLG